MRNFTKNLILLLGMTLTMVACHKEATEWGTDTPTDTEVGYLSLAKESLIVDERIEQIGANAGTSAATRAANLNVDTYTVEICNTADNSVVKSFAYGERGTAPIELPVGSYYLNVYSGTTPASAWEGDAGSPTYGARTEAFAIKKDNTVDNPVVLSNVITCRLLTVKATVSFHKSLYALLSSDTEAELLLSETNGKTYTSAEFGVIEKSGTETTYESEPKACYLKPIEGQQNPLVLYLTTKFEGKQITRQPLNITSNAKAGEFRKITVNLENADDGSIIITASIETWVYDEKVNIDVATLAVLTESTIPNEGDPNAPKFTWGEYSFEEPYILNADLFDENGNCTADCNITLTAKNPIQNFSVSVSSDNASFTEYITANGLNNKTDLCSSETSTAKTTLRSWGFPTSNLSGQTARTFNIGNLMTTLYPAYEGTHTFTMEVIDSEGLKSTTELTITVDLSAGVDPNIRWIGYDIDQRYVAFDGMEIKVKATATKGVKSLIVRISGALDLEGMVPAEFDLTDPDATKEGLSATLAGFGFPVGSEVIDAKELNFEISKFIPLMASFQGDTDFTMSLTDNEGNNITKAIMITIE